VRASCRLRALHRAHRRGARADNQRRGACHQASAPPAPRPPLPLPLPLWSLSLHCTFLFPSLPLLSLLPPYCLPLPMSLLYTPSLPLLSLLSLSLSGESTRRRCGSARPGRGPLGVLTHPFPPLCARFAGSASTLGSTTAQRSPLQCASTLARTCSRTRSTSEASEAERAPAKATMTLGGGGGGACEASEALPLEPFLRRARGCWFLRTPPLAGGRRWRRGRCGGGWGALESQQRGVSVFVRGGGRGWRPPVVGAVGAVTRNVSRVVMKRILLSLHRYRPPRRAGHASQPRRPQLCQRHGRRRQRGQRRERRPGEK